VPGGIWDWAGGLQTHTKRKEINQNALKKKKSESRTSTFLWKLVSATE